MMSGPPVREKTEFPLEEQIQLIKSPLSEEEAKSRNNCVYNLLWKIALPFAVITQLGSILRKNGEIDRTQKALLRRGFTFFGNIFLAAFLIKPYCDYQVLAKRIELERKNRDMRQEGKFLSTTEEGQPASQLDDFSYPIDLMTNLNEPEGSFSTDFTSSRLEMEGEKDIEETKNTTYQDLRARHRNKYGNRSTPPASTLNFDSGTMPSVPSSPVENPVPVNEPPSVRKPRKLNKYGDEME